jgi:hypothetical protein
MFIYQRVIYIYIHIGTFDSPRGLTQNLVSLRFNGRRIVFVSEVVSVTTALFQQRLRSNVANVATESLG